MDSEKKNSIGQQGRAEQQGATRTGDSKSTAANKNDFIEHESAAQRPLTRTNFIAMAIAGAMIVLGFILMLGGSTTETEFNPDIFSTRRIVVGPAIAFLGFVAMAIAIIIKPRKKD
ncbi:MAG: DUF3098 domain-containing protein [Muribaculaceae bacterium]|nr:DUF3098 domain-containing protein [Muribaculaceae bacterium]